MLNSSAKRLIWVDVARGLAVIGMVIFHVFFLVDFLGYADFAFKSGILNVLARSVQFTFLGLVGVSLVLSHERNKGWKFYRRQWERFGKIGVAALLVTVVTSFVVPDIFVRFGILHLIALSILVLSPLANRPGLALGIGLWAILLGQYLSSFSSSSVMLIILGFSPKPGFAALDHFAIFPWISLPALGIALGYYLKRFSGRHFWGEKFMSLLGKHSLIIYLLHVPILLGIINLIAIMLP